LTTLLISAIAISLAIQLIVIYLSHKKDILIDKGDENKPQRFHTAHTPRAGGIGIFTSNLLLLFIPSGWKLLLAGVFVFTSGILEDLLGNLSPKLRLALQTLSALIAAFLLGAVLQHTDLFSVPFTIAVLFAIFAVVGVVNAINIIDGFNGLASGISVMILLSFLAVSIEFNDSFLTDVIIINIGALLGFMALNFPKGKIFMGDGGAYFVGFIVAESAILLYERHYLDISAWYILATLIYPVTEVLYSIYRKKIIRGISPLKPDKSHFHMLVNKRITRSNPKTSVMIWLYNAPFIIVALLFKNNNTALMAICLLFAIFYIYRYNKMIGFSKK